MKEKAPNHKFKVPNSNLFRVTNVFLSSMFVIWNLVLAQQGHIWENLRLYSFPFGVKA